MIFLWSLGRTKITAPLFSFVMFLAISHILLRERIDIDVGMILYGVGLLICIPILVLMIKKRKEKESLILKIFAVSTGVFYAAYLFCITDMFHEWPIEHENWYKQGELIYAKNGELFTGTISFHQNRCLTGRNYVKGLLVDVNIYNCPRSKQTRYYYPNMNLYNQGKLALRRRVDRSPLRSSFVEEVYYEDGNIAIREEVVRGQGDFHASRQYFNKNGEKTVEIQGSQNEYVCIDSNGNEFSFSRSKKAFENRLKKMAEENKKVWSDWEYEPQLSCEQLVSL